MPRPPPIAAFVHKHGGKIALAALFVSAVVLSVSFVANLHGLNRLALEQRGISSHRDTQDLTAADNLLHAPTYSDVQHMFDAVDTPSRASRSPSSSHSLSEAQKLVDEYSRGSSTRVTDSAEAPHASAALPERDHISSVSGDGLELAPPLPGAMEPAYTSLSVDWIPMKVKGSHEAALASGSGGKCFDIKNLKSFFPPGFGLSQAAKKGSNAFDKFLTKAMLPTFGELEAAVKCVPSIAKSMKAAVRSPKNALSALKTIDGCMATLASITDKCESSPSMMSLSAVPKVGPMVSYVCGLLSKVVEKYMFVKEHVEKLSTPPVFECSLSKAAINTHAQLFIAAHADSHPLDAVVSYHELKQQLESYAAYQVHEGDSSAPLQSELSIKKIGDAVKKTANKAGDAVKKTANNAGDAVKKTANKVGDAVQKLDPMKLLDSLLKKAQLPTVKELVSIVKCVVPVSKGLKKLLGKPSLSAANSVFETMDGCMCKLDKLSQQCEGPVVMAISSQDPVGQVIGYVCSMAAKAVSKYTTIRDAIQQGVSVVSVVGHATKAASSSSKSKASKAAPSEDSSSTSTPSKKKKAKLAINVIKKIGSAVKSVEDPLDAGLKKAGLPTLKEMGGVMKCTVTISKSFKKLIKSRDPSSLLSVLQTMDGCISKLAALSEKCDGPAVMAASMVPLGVGNAVSTVCSTSSSIVEKYRGFTTALAAAGFNTDACPVNSGGQEGQGKSAKSGASKSKKSSASKSKGNKSSASKSKGNKSSASKSKGKKSSASKSKANKNKGKGNAKKNNGKSNRRPPPAIIFRQDRGAAVESYSPPWNVYLLWAPSMQNMREYSETSVTSSEFVRRALRMGSRSAGSIDPHESHFLSGGFDSPKFVNDLANTCCSVIVAPPFENGFDVYSPADKTESRIQQRLRDFVANGNSIVVTGGVMSQLFLNRNFLTQLEPVAGNYDDGPFRLNVRFQKATATRSSQFNRMGFDVLEQMGHNVYAVEAKSLPPQSKVVFSSMDGGVVVAVIPYCQGFPSQYDNAQTPVAISVDRCDYLKAKSRRLGRTRPDQAPCSCGSLVYLGFDYSDFSDMPSDVRRWVKVLRAASTTTWGAGRDRGSEDNEVLNNQRNFQ